MQPLYLVSPTPEHREAVLQYRAEFEQSGDSMDGTAGLASAESYEAWLLALHDNARPETVRAGMVDASTFLAMRRSDGRLVGMIDIRHRLNEYLLRFGGHIGYSVRPSERRQGYAGQMLRLALEQCASYSLKRVLITCDSENIASRKTILHAGGKLENEVPEEGRLTQRYWICLE